MPSSAGQFWTVLRTPQMRVVHFGQSFKTASADIKLPLSPGMRRVQRVGPKPSERRCALPDGTPGGDAFTL